MAVFSIPQDRAQQLESDLKREFEMYRLAMAQFKLLPLDDRKFHTLRAQAQLDAVVRMIHEATQGVEDRFGDREASLRQIVEEVLTSFRTGAHDCTSGVLPLEV